MLLSFTYSNSKKSFNIGYEKCPDLKCIEKNLSDHAKTFFEFISTFDGIIGVCPLLHDNSFRIFFVIHSMKIR